MALQRQEVDIEGGGGVVPPCVSHSFPLSPSSSSSFPPFTVPWAVQQSELSPDGVKLDREEESNKELQMEEAEIEGLGV